jgi:hypothetical protein
MPRSLMLSRTSSAIMSLFGPFILGFCLLSFQEGALRPNMPTKTAMMANRRSSNGMRLLSAWIIIINLFLLFIFISERKLWDCRLYKYSLRKKEHQKRKLHTRDQSCHLGSSGRTTCQSTSHQ